MNTWFAKSDELRVALAPSAAYAALLERERDIRWARALRRPAFVVLLIGIVATIAATGRVTLPSIGFTAAAWAFAVILQIGVGAAIIGSARMRRVGMARALDLWFAGHLPWSAWLLLVMASIRLFPFFSLELLLVTMILPMVWTAVIAAAFCRTVLGNAAGTARLRAAVHQAVTLALLLSFIAWSAGGWFRLAG